MSSQNNLSLQLNALEAKLLQAVFVALNKRQINMTDVIDARALQSIHPELRFADAVDKPTGFRSVQMIKNPVLAGDAKLGVLEIKNKKWATFLSISSQSQCLYN